MLSVSETKAIKSLYIIDSLLNVWFYLLVISTLF